LQAQTGTSSSTSATLSGVEWYYSPGTTTQTGGTLSATVPTTSTTLSSLGTLNAALANTSDTVGGTLAANVADTSATWSSRGTLAAALNNTSDTFSSLGTLSGAINSSTTSIKVTESGTPPSTPFVIKIDTEQMNVTARAHATGCTGATWCYTVTRAYNGTTAASHSNGAAVTYRSAVGCPTTCTSKVNETSAPPTGTPFTILVDSEQMNVTSRTLVSGSTYQYAVTRAYNGTTAAAHSSGATVQYYVAGCPTTCSFNVTETSAPPTGTPFTIQVDSEKMSVTSRTLVSGSTYTYAVTRATSGTTAAAHTSGCAASAASTSPSSTR
jgi:hypothetical protein